MKLFNHRKSEAIVILLIVVVLVLFFGWLISFTSKECRSNSQCPKDNYCGSDFSCHQIPVIEKTAVENNLLMPSIILGIAIIAAALILKSEKISLNPFRKNKQQEAEANNEAGKNPLRMP